MRVGCAYLFFVFSFFVLVCYMEYWGERGLYPCHSYVGTCANADGRTFNPDTQEQLRISEGASVRCCCCLNSERYYFT